jgi:hypothetical protein
MLRSANMVDMLIFFDVQVSCEKSQVYTVELLGFGEA